MSENINENNSSSTTTDIQDSPQEKTTIQKKRHINYVDGVRLEEKYKNDIKKAATVQDKIKAIIKIHDVKETLARGFDEAGMKFYKRHVSQPYLCYETHCSKNLNIFFNSNNKLWKSNQFK